MNRTLMNTILASGLALGIAIGPARAQTSPGESPATKHPSASAAENAIQRAADANKYIFLLFYRADDEATQAARSTFDAAMPRLADRAMSATVNITDSQEKPLVKRFDLDWAPMPLLLAVAPNGAITGSFPVKFKKEQLETAFVSPGMQKCLKALQDRKLVLLCIQNGDTQHNADALKGAKEFAADSQYAKTTEIITVDPKDLAEATLLKQFKVDPKTTEAVTVFLAPPGTTVATYKGETRKDVLVAAMKSAAKGCDPKSGCCPPKKS